MISERIQARIRQGDREAFRALYGNYSRDVYLAAQEVLHDNALARTAVKQTFLRIHREVLEADGPIDTDLRIDLIANEEIARLRGDAPDGDAQPLQSRRTALCRLRPRTAEDRTGEPKKRLFPRVLPPAFGASAARSC